MFNFMLITLFLGYCNGGVYDQNNGLSEEDIINFMQLNIADDINLENVNFAELSYDALLNLIYSKTINPEIFDESTEIEIINSLFEFRIEEEQLESLVKFFKDREVEVDRFSKNFLYELAKRKDFLSFLYDRISNQELSENDAAYYSSIFGKILESRFGREDADNGRLSLIWDLLVNIEGDLQTFNYLVWSIEDRTSLFNLIILCCQELDKGEYNEDQNSKIVSYLSTLANFIPNDIPKRIIMEPLSGVNSFNKWVFLSLALLNYNIDVTELLYTMFELDLDNNFKFCYRDTLYSLLNNRKFDIRERINLARFFIRKCLFSIEEAEEVLSIISSEGIFSEFNVHLLSLVDEINDKIDLSKINSDLIDDLESQRGLFYRYKDRIFN